MLAKELHTIILYIVLPFVGLGIIVFALTWGTRLGKRPVEIAIAKWGLNLKLDTLTFLILIGFIMAGVGGFLWYQDYGKQISEAKNKLGQKEIEVETYKQFVEKFKLYSMRFHLNFPETDIVNVRKIKVQVYILKQDKGPPQLSDTEPVVGLMNDLWVSIDNLNPGDKLRIIAYEGQEKSWESLEVEIPKTHLQLRKVK